MRRIVDLPLAFRGFDIPDRFVVGYGLDYHQRYRNLPFIGVLKPELLEPLTHTGPQAASSTAAAAPPSWTWFLGPTLQRGAVQAVSRDPGDAMPGVYDRTPPGHPSQAPRFP